MRERLEYTRRYVNFTLDPVEHEGRSPFDWLMSRYFSCHGLYFDALLACLSPHKENAFWHAALQPLFSVADAHADTRSRIKHVVRHKIIIEEMPHQLVRNPDF